MVWLKQSDEVPKEKEHYTCMACITIDSVIDSGTIHMFI